MYIKNLNKAKEGYIFNSDIDFSKIKKITGISSFQHCEPKEEKTLKINNVIFLFKNKYHVLKFDFENNSFSINDTNFTVSETQKYIFRKMDNKNHFKAINGINGLYESIIESINPEDIFHYQYFKYLTKCSNKEPKEI